MLFYSSLEGLDEARPHLGARLRYSAPSCKRRSHKHTQKWCLTSRPGASQPSRADALNEPRVTNSTEVDQLSRPPLGVQTVSLCLPRVSSLCPVRGAAPLSHRGVRLTSSRCLLTPPCFTFHAHTYHACKSAFIVPLLSLEGTFKESRGFSHSGHPGPSYNHGPRMLAGVGISQKFR